MKVKLKVLENNESILIEINQLQKFLDYSFSRAEYYSYRLEYTDNDMVLITLIDRHSIVKLKVF